MSLGLFHCMSKSVIDYLVQTAAAGIETPFSNLNGLNPCSGYEISQSLKAHLAAAQSLQRLAVQTVKVEGLAKSKDESMASIVQNLLEVTVSDAGKRAVISALIFIPGAFQAILSLSKVQPPIAL